MGSDMPSGFGPPLQMGNNFSISYSSQSREETDELFANISAGGTVTMAPAEMFWGSYYGSCIDKFGIGWQFNYDLASGVAPNRALWRWPAVTPQFRAVRWRQAKWPTRSLALNWIPPFTL